jgi:hypothetical protein
MQKQAAKKKPRLGRPALLVDSVHSAVTLPNHVLRALIKRSEQEGRSTADLLRSILLGESPPLDLGLQASRVVQLGVVLPAQLDEALRARAPKRKLAILVRNILTGYEPPFKLDRAKIYL